MRVLLIDTSLMLDCVNLKIDVFTELEGLMDGPHELRVSEGVMRELRRLAGAAGRKGRDAKVALALLEGRAKVEEDAEPVDEWLLSRGKELGATVCTNDSELRERLRKAGVGVISVRGRSRLDRV